MPFGKRFDIPQPASIVKRVPERDSCAREMFPLKTGDSRPRMASGGTTEYMGTRLKSGVIRVHRITTVIKHFAVMSRCFRDVNV